MKSYRTIEKDTTAEIVERKSRFIANVANVNSEDEAHEFISKLKSQHYDARHNVYAYIVEDTQNEFVKYSDDGEPQGTAGMPILDVIRKNDLKNVCVVVTRYFGGILLGAGGLVRAYSSAASLGIKEAGVVTMVWGDIHMFRVSYTFSDKLQYILKQEEYFIESIDYMDEVSYKVFVPDGKYEDILKIVTETTSGEYFSMKTQSGVYRPLQIDN